MTHRPARIIPALVLAACAMLPAAGADEAAEDRAAALARQAAELTQQQKYDEALDLLRQAQEAAPTYAPAQEWLAHVYELKGDKEQALSHIAALLALQPRSKFGLAAAKRLFYTPPFPRTLNTATLAISPLKFTVDRGCALTDERVPGYPARQALCYSTSMKYPEDGADGGPIVERKLPGPGDVTAQFNRAVYGYRENPETGEFGLRVIAYYPSPLLSGSDTDLSATAQALTHLMLRFQTYVEGYLGLPSQGGQEGINRLWLCLQGPDGAERQESDILFYRALAETRSPLEWMRELAHECGHLMIPQIGGFAAPEMWGNGEVGERLLLYWLAEEAGGWGGQGWPSAKAVSLLDGIWPGCGAPIEDYLAASGRAPLGVWAGEGPESELIMGMDDRAMQFYVGFTLYVLAAHGANGLRDVVKSCAGTTTADFVYAYRRTVGAWAKDGPLTFGVGCFNPAETKLTQAPPAADLCPRPLTLAAGDAVAYRVFLPTGTWRLAPGIREAGAKVLVSFDGGQEAEVEMTPAREPVLIGPLTEGWHKLRLRGPAGQAPIHLEALTFSQGPVA
jgi:tetratricopeptide (TPR) repeat protein